MSFLGFDAVNVNAASQAAMTNSLFRFALIKATEGQGWTAPDYNTLKAMARTNNKLFGAYHYGWTEQDPVLEAKNFVGFAQLLPGDVAVLDVERQVGLPTTTSDPAFKPWWERAVNYMVVWLTEVNKALNVRPIVYINNYWRTWILTYATQAQKDFLTSHALWLSQPNVAQGATTVNSTWAADIHQYLFETGIDRNWYAHSEWQWKALTIPEPPKPPTTIEQVLAAVNSQSNLLSAQSADLSTLKAGVTKVTADIDAVASSVDDVSIMVSPLSGQIGEVDTKLTTLDMFFGTLDDAIGGLEAQVNEQDASIMANTDRLTTLEETVDVRFQELKDRINIMPADMNETILDALSGFALTVSYPKRTS